MPRVSILLIALLALAIGPACTTEKAGCTGGTSLCGGTCVDLSSDNLNCGVCGIGCGAGTSCQGGTCTSTCGTGLVACGASCVDPLTDPDHCGASGNCFGPNAGMTCTGGDTCRSGTCAPPPTTVDLTTHQAAAFALGQPDLVTDAPPTGGCAPGSLYVPYGSAAFDGAYLFASDTSGNRVHAYAGLPTASGPLPAFSLGSATCASPGDPVSGGDFGWPQSIRIDDSGSAPRLLLTDTLNNRVLVYATVPADATALASVAVGQPDLTTWAWGCTASALDGPQGIATAGGKLVVADTNNHRVLIWNAIPTASGTAADLVLGQSNADGTPNFGPGCLANTDPLAPAGQVTAWTMYLPTDAWTDGTRLLVADSGNHRILVWNAFPTASGQPADAVVGQPNFTSNLAPAPATATGLSSPVSVASDGTHLFVADFGNHRVLGYDAIPTSSTWPAATLVLGQADLASSSANEGGAVSATSLSGPSGLAVVGRKLLVTDSGNNRLVVYVSPP